MTLADAKEGQWLVITGVGDELVAMQALRFGIDQGCQIRVEKNIAGGPVIVAKNQLEIAIGREFAALIDVELKGGPNVA